MIDPHVHLNDPAFDPDRMEVLQRARSQGITLLVDVTEDWVSARRSIALFEREKDVWSTLGHHPHLARLLNPEEILEYKKFVNQEKIVAIGEIGLDYYYDKKPREIQREAFSQMLELAVESDLPVIVHSRESEKDLIEILSSQSGKIKGVIHCYTGDLESAQLLLEMGFYISFSGIVTFKNALPLREVARVVPLDRIFVETDCPYLAPEPMRGKRNEPGFVRYVLDKVAEIKAVKSIDLEQKIAENAHKLFAKIRGEEE